MFVVCMGLRRRALVPGNLASYVIYISRYFDVGVNQISQSSLLSFRYAPSTFVNIELQSLPALCRYSMRHSKCVVIKVVGLLSSPRNLHPDYLVSFWSL